MFSDPQIAKLMQKLQGAKGGFGGGKNDVNNDMQDDDIKETTNDELKQSDFEFDNAKYEPKIEKNNNEQPKQEKKQQEEEQKKTDNKNVLKKKEKATAEFKMKNYEVAYKL